MKKFVFIVLLSMPVAVYAQYVSKLGRFRVSEQKGCAPLSITFETLIPGGCGQVPCVIDFDGDGQFDDGSTSPLQYNYTSPGKYVVKVIYQNQDNQVDEIEIEVVASSPPAFDLYTCNANAVQVKVTDTKYDQYRISYSDGTSVTVPSGSLARDNHTFASSGAKSISVRGVNLNAADNCSSATKSFNALVTIPTPQLTTLSNISTDQIEALYTLGENVLGRLEIAGNNNTSFQQVKSVYADNRDTIRSVNNETSFYCLRISAINACTNTGTPSSSVCSISLTATANDGLNQLSWKNDATGILNYTINRNSQPLATGIPPSSKNYSDNNIVCNTEYCYQVIGTYSRASARSLTKCVTGFNTQKPPALSNITASINTNNETTLTWTPTPQAASYSISKTTTQSITLTTSVLAPPFIDTDFTPPACYEIAYKDVCNNESIPTKSCPIVLTASLNSNNTVSLVWSNYVGWQNGVAAYRVDRYSQEGTLLGSDNVGSNNSFTDETIDLNNQTVYYNIVALSHTNSISPASSNQTQIIRKPNLFYPKAFTPNHDKLNDEFKVFGQYISSFDMKIFNRWGELVHTSSNIEQGWDGTYQDKEQPEGTYIFIADIVDFAGRKTNHSGSIILLKKERK